MNTRLLYTFYAVAQELIIRNLKDRVKRAKKRKKLCSSAESQDIISMFDGHLECRAALGAINSHGADLLFQPQHAVAVGTFAVSVRFIVFYAIDK